MTAIVAANQPTTGNIRDIPAECACCDSPIVIKANTETFEMESYEHPDNNCMGKLMIHSLPKESIKEWLAANPL